MSEHLHGRGELSNMSTTTIYVSEITSRSTTLLLKTYHTHNHYEINYVTYLSKPSVSESYLMVKNNRYDFNHNSILLIPPGIKHYTSRNTKNSKRILINLKPSYINSVAEFINLDLRSIFSKHVLNFSDTQMYEISSILNNIVSIHKSSKNPETDIELKLLITQLLYKLSLAKNTSVPINKDDSVIEQIIDYIKNNYFDNITLESLSEQFFISKFEICRKIKDYTNSTFNELLTNLRINSSKKLLEETNLPILDIAKKVGYNSSSYFTTAFKKATGVSPVNYRKNFKK